MNNKSFLIIGYFGYIDGQIDGQTLKTRNVYKLLKELSKKVTIFDTQNLKSNLFSYFKLMWLILFSKNIILLPGKNSLTKLFLYLHCICKLMKKNIFIFAVGGWLSEFLSENKSIEVRFQNVNHIFVESKSMKERLILNNFLLSSKVSEFPNFRISSFLPQINSESAIFRIIFIARITESKGCDYIFNFLDFYIKNREFYNKKIVVNFYGPIDIAYNQIFMDNLKLYPDIAFYGGIIPSEQVYDVIGNSDVTVLPTSYSGEGFPGTIIDSYMSAVPVIVSRWKDLPEFVIHGETGFVFDLDRPEDLYSYIQNLVNDSYLLNKMKLEALKHSKLYSVEEARRILETIL